MLGSSPAFSGFSSNRIEESLTFYRDVLGLSVEETMGGLALSFPQGGSVFVYPKDDHEPATFTVLNFPVPDIESAVDALNAKGVRTKIYSDEDFPTDAKGIAREMGPLIAWFRDPAGNVLSVIEE